MTVTITLSAEKLSPPINPDNELETWVKDRIKGLFGVASKASFVGAFDEFVAADCNLDQITFNKEKVGRQRYREILEEKFLGAEGKPEHLELDGVVAVPDQKPIVALVPDGPAGAFLRVLRPEDKGPNEEPLMRFSTSSIHISVKNGFAITIDHIMTEATSQH